MGCKCHIALVENHHLSVNTLNSPNFLNAHDSQAHENLKNLVLSRVFKSEGVFREVLLYHHPIILRCMCTTRMPPLPPLSP